MLMKLPKNNFKKMENNPNAEKDTKKVYILLVVIALLIAIVFTLLPFGIAPNRVMLTVSFLKEVDNILKLGCFCA